MLRPHRLLAALLGSVVIVGALIPDGVRADDEAVPTLSLRQQDVSRVAVVFDGIIPPFLEVEFTKQGTKRLSDFTGSNIGKTTILMIGTDVVMRPKVESPVNAPKCMFAPPGVQPEKLLEWAKLIAPPVKAE